MGFGYLFIGYLVTFVLRMLADALNLGALALLAGYGTMLMGLCTLRRYCRSFTWAAWTLAPLSLIALYRGLETLKDVFFWRIPIVNSAVGNVLSWAELLLLMLFHAFLLSSIREIAMRVELPRLAAFALRNSAIVLIYGIVYVVGKLPFGFTEAVQGYLGLFLNLLLIIWVVCNLVLLLSCAKNIAKEGEADEAPRRYRWNFLNRLGDAYAKNFQRASDRSRRDVEDYLQKKQEKRNAKKSTSGRSKPYHHKKKK